MSILFGAAVVCYKNEYIFIAHYSRAYQSELLFTISDFHILQIENMIGNNGDSELTFNEFR